MFNKEEWYILDNYATDNSNILIKENVKKFIKNYENNYIFLYGPKGVGKTHLIRSIIRNFSKQNLIYYSSVNDYPPSKKAEIVILDNLNFLSEEKLENTFNWISKTNSSFVLAYRGERQEKPINILIEKFGDDNSYYIPEPGYELKKGILENYVKYYNLEISNESIEYILNSFENWPKPINAIERIITYSKLSAISLSNDSIPYIINELKKTGF